MNIYDDLKWRGLVHQVSDEDKIRQYLDTPGRTLYCGFDPTAKSLHIGNMVPLMALYRFRLAGHDPIFLAGGGTGMIGDPSGKDAERQLKSSEELAANIANIRAQVEKLFGGRARIENNLDWLGELTAIGLLRDVGKHFTVNWMMAKDSVKSRLGREEVGISYTEFSYMILQAYDFYVLANEHDCRLQIGGSDQWGNITAGAELIRRKGAGEAFCLTFPLITTAEGKKFGKSEKGAVYLDPEMTPPFEFYQYWVRADDRDVVRFLKYFTFLEKDEIDALAEAVENRPHLREAQKRLAAEMTTLVHGADELLRIERAVDALYGKGDIREVDAATLKNAVNEAPSVNYPALSEVPDLPQVLVDLGLCPSKGRARKDILAGAVSINQDKVADPAWSPAADDLLHGQAMLVRKGKKNYGLVRVESSS